jgi:copper(I)-binding protein
MKSIFGIVLILTLTAGDAVAEEFKVGSLVVENPWARETPKGATVGGAYLEIKNNGAVPDRLIGGSVNVAKQFQVHNMTMENGVSKMREVTGGLEIKPGATVKLEPGSSHVMLVGLTQPLRAGEKVHGTLKFEHAGTIDIEYPVLGIGAKGPASDNRSPR